APIDTAPRFELIDRGDAVEVIAHNIKAARTAVLPVRSRLEVPITGAPQAKRVTPGDATVKLIELDSSDSTRVLSVKLGFERADVKALSRFAQAIQVGDDLHLLFPRKLPDGDVAPRLPEPTIPAALAGRTEPAHPVAARIEPPTPPVAMRPDPPAPAPAPVPAPVLGPRTDPRPAPPAPAALPVGAQVQPADAHAHPPAAGRPRSAADALAATAAAHDGTAPPAAAAPSAPASDARAVGQVLATDRDDVWSRISLYAALGLAAAGLGVWFLRRRRIGVRPGAPASIDIIAQRSLGGKARIVWLSAGQREMIVAVTAQQVRVLGQWRKTETTAALPAAHGYAEPEAARGSSQSLPNLSAVMPFDRPISPAVSGLLRLRGRTGQMAAVVPDLSDGEVAADELWAKEILAATGARR
ncbi:MAG TPA: flagellar biosynthetic protein FliO, partial [Kofleriaceae bacterium]|nr:flagellar biosynthetic protein FliO [Kofleriaceae bacterium]